MEGIHPLRRLTTLPPKQIVVPMTCPTSKASAGPVTNRRQRLKESNNSPLQATNVANTESQNNNQRHPDFLEIL